MATTTATAALSMRLVVDTNAQRVLFAEASKDVVDFLFSLLTLPVGTTVSLLGEESMVGCVGNLYTSVVKLDDIYVQSGAPKDALLRPVVLSPAVSTNSSLLGLPAPTSFRDKPKTFFRCDKPCNSGHISFGAPPQLGDRGNCRNYMTDNSFTACPSCGGQMTKEVKFVSPPGSGGQTAQEAAGGGAKKGFVQGIVTYTVMDDLKVSPMSSISSIALLNTFAIKDLGALQEKTVQLGYDEGLKILKASLQSKTVLTDVFLLGKPPSSSA